MKEYRDKEWLRKRYFDDGMTFEEMADAAGVSPGTVNKWFHRHGLEPRNHGEWQVKRHAPLRMLSTGYEYWDEGRSESADGKIVYVHRLLAVAEYGFHAVGPDKDVHHKNGIPWDNRPENIEVLGRGEHASQHWSRDRFEDYWGDAPYKDEEKLRALYFDDGLSMQKISDEFDVGLGTIQYWMDKFDIERRSRDEAGRKAWETRGGS